MVVGGGHQGTDRNLFFCRLLEIICSTFVTVPKAAVTKCLSAMLSKGLFKN